MQIEINLYWIGLSAIIALPFLIYKVYSFLYPDLPIGDIAQRILDDLDKDDWIYDKKRTIRNSSVIIELWYRAGYDSRQTSIWCSLGEKSFMPIPLNRTEFKAIENKAFIKYKNIDTQNKLNELAKNNSLIRQKILGEN